MSHSVLISVSRLISLSVLCQYLCQLSCTVQEIQLVRAVKWHVMNSLSMKAQPQQQKAIVLLLLQQCPVYFIHNTII